MSPQVERVAIIGLGLLGGSVAAAAQRAGVAKVVVGSSRSGDAREIALRRQWVDEAGSSVGPGGTVWLHGNTGGFPRNR